MSHSNRQAWQAIQAVCPHLAAGFLWLTLKFIPFYILKKISCLSTLCSTVYIKSSNHWNAQLSNFGTISNTGALWLGWIWFIWYFWEMRATYVSSFLVTLMDPFGFRKDTEIMCMWIGDSMNLTWMWDITFHPVCQEGIRGPTPVVVPHLKYLM